MSETRELGRRIITDSGHDPDALSDAEWCIVDEFVEKCMTRMDEETRANVIPERQISVAEARALIEDSINELQERLAF